MSPRTSTDDSSYVGLSFQVMKQTVFLPRSFRVFEEDFNAGLLHVQALDDGETWWVQKTRFLAQLGTAFVEKS